MDGGWQRERLEGDERGGEDRWGKIGGERVDGGWQRERLEGG